MVSIKQLVLAFSTLALATRVTGLTQEEADARCVKKLGAGYVAKKNAEGVYTGKPSYILLSYCNFANIPHFRLRASSSTHQRISASRMSTQIPRRAFLDAVRTTVHFPMILHRRRGNAVPRDQSSLGMLRPKRETAAPLLTARTASTNVHAKLRRRRMFLQSVRTAFLHSS